MKTYSFNTDAVGDDEPIVAQSCCTRVVIYEDGQAGTADYLIRSSAADAPITRPAGSKTEIFAPLYPGSSAPRPFEAGQTIGYISAATGVLTMVQEEY